MSLTVSASSESSDSNHSEGQSSRLNGPGQSLSILPDQTRPVDEISESTLGSFMMIVFVMAPIFCFSTPTTCKRVGCIYPISRNSASIICGKSVAEYLRT